MIPFIIYFSNSVKWRKPGAPDTLLQPFLNANKELWIDISAPKNVLNVYGEFIPKKDSARIVIDSIQLMDSSVVQTVIVRYSEDKDFTFFTDVPLPYVEFEDSLGVGRLSFLIENFLQQNYEKHTMYLMWYILAKNTSKSLKRYSDFEVGWDRPLWAGEFNAMPTHRSDQIAFSWPDQGGVDSMRIWWNNNDSIPYEYDYTVLSNSTTQPPHYVTVTGTIDTLKGLAPKTKYFFGAQIFKDRMWSRVSRGPGQGAEYRAGGFVLV
jgi:hypothetical protein